MHCLWVGARAGFCVLGPPASQPEVFANLPTTAIINFDNNASSIVVTSSMNEGCLFKLRFQTNLFDKIVLSKLVF
jgi:hypothetical protein